MGEQGVRFGLQITGQLAAALGNFGLFTQQLQPWAELGMQIAEALEVALGAVQPPTGVVAAGVVARYPGALFEQQPAVFGTEAEGSVDFALADDHAAAESDAAGA